MKLASSPIRSVEENNSTTVAEVLAAFLDHTEAHYVDADGKQTKEVAVLKYAIKPVRELYLVPVSVYEALRTLAGLRRGRTIAQ